jgi:hypothetical protein
MLIHCLNFVLSGKQELAAYDREEGTAIYVRLAQAGRVGSRTAETRVSVTVGFKQPLSSVMRERATRRAIQRFVDDRRAFIKETRGLSADWLK